MTRTTKVIATLNENDENEYESRTWAHLMGKTGWIS